MKYFSVRHIAFLLTVYLFSACSHLPNELNTAEKLLEDKPDSALIILKNISPDKYSKAEARALYNLLYIRALDKKHLPLQPDSLIDFSIEYYKKHNNANRLAYILLMKGRSYYYRSEYEKAVNEFLYALDEVKDTTDYLLMGRINADIARISDMQKDYDYALRRFNSALNYYRKGGHKNQYLYSIIYIGRIYTEQKKFKEAIGLQKKNLYMATDSLIMGDMYDQIGKAYYDNKQIDSALFYFRQTIHYPYIGYNKAIRCMNIANSYFDINKVDSAEYYATLAFHYKPEWRTQRECHRILTNCAFRKGDKKAEVLHMNQYVFIGDSLRKIDSQTKGSYIEKVLKSTKDAERSKGSVFLLTILVLLSLLTAAGLFFILKKRHQQKETDLIRIHEEARLQSKDQVRQELIDVLKQKIADSKNLQADMRKKASPTDREVMIRAFYTELLHLDDWNKFTREMCPMFGNLTLKLETDYPTLTRKEISWCCLYLLGISQSDILTIMEYKPASYSKFKQRLAKKLNLSDATELNDFLNRKASEQ